MTDDAPPPQQPGGFPPPPPPQQPGGYAAPPPSPGAWQAQPPPGAWQGPPSTPYGAANPYGYAAAAPVPPTMRSLGGLATALTILLAIVALVDLAAAGALLDRASLLDDPSPSFGELVDADDRVGAAVGSHLFGVVVVGIVWVIWQFRFVKNVEALRRPTGFSPGFAIGGWFIPIGNLFIPEQQLAVSARSSDPNALAGGGSTPGVLYGWWATFVGMFVLQAIGSGSRPDDNDVFSSTTVSDFQTADQIQGLGLALGAVCAVLAILTVRTCTKRQEQMLVGLSAQAYGQQPGPYPGGPGPVTF